MKTIILVNYQIVIVRRGKASLETSVGILKNINLTLQVILYTTLTYNCFHFDIFLLSAAPNRTCTWNYSIICRSLFIIGMGIILKIILSFNFMLIVYGFISFKSRNRKYGEGGKCFTRGLWNFVYSPSRYIWVCLYWFQYFDLYFKLISLRSLQFLFLFASL